MELENNRDEIEIDVKELFMFIMSKFFIILFVGILGAMATFAYTKLMVTPQYTSSTEVYILNKPDTDNLTTSDLAFASYLALDYQELIVSAPVLKEVIQKLNLNMTTKTLASHISVALKENTRIIKITVSSESPQLSKSIADTVRDAVNEKTKDVMGGIEAVNPIDEASLPDGPSSPNVMKNTAIGFLGGAFVVIIILVIMFILDDTIKTQEDIEKYLNLSVLAAIPYQSSSDVDKKKKGKKRKE